MENQPSAGLRVLISHDGPRLTAVLDGELDLASGPYLRSRLLDAPQCRAGGPVNVIEIDASGLSFVDVAGLGALVDVALAADRAGCAFRLRRTMPLLDRLLDLLDLESLVARNGSSAGTTRP